MTHRLLASCLAAVAAATCVSGAKVLVVAQMRDGKPTAVRALAGRDGFTPPM